MKSSLPAISKSAIVLLALLSIGPLVTGLDLVLNFLPTQFPAFQHLHAASSLGKSLWVGSGFLALLSIFLLVRQPELAKISGLAFAIAYVSGANMVWLYFTPACGLAIAGFLLTFFGAHAAMRANNSFKRTCLRHAAYFRR